MHTYILCGSMVTHYDMRVADRRVVDDNRRSNKYKNTLSGGKGTMVIDEKIAWGTVSGVCLLLNHTNF